MLKQSSDIEFALIKISTEQFALLDENISNKENVRLSVGFRFAANKEKKIVGVFCQVSFESNEKKFIVVEIGCHFSLKAESWDSLTENSGQRLILPIEIARHFAMLTLGTCRGVLHAKTEGSIYNQYLLPTINVASLINEDSIFDFSDD